MSSRTREEYRRISKATEYEFGLGKCRCKSDYLEDKCKIGEYQPDPCCCRKSLDYIAELERSICYLRSEVSALRALRGDDGWGDN